MKIKRIMYALIFFALLFIFLSPPLAKILQLNESLSLPLLLKSINFFGCCFNWLWTKIFLPIFVWLWVRPLLSIFILYLLLAIFIHLFVVEVMLRVKEGLIKLPQAKTVIKRFKSCHTLLIKGEWGIGKTSFYEGSLEPLFKQDKLLKKFSVVYISCSGLNTVDELVNEILNKCMPLQWAAIIFNRFKQFFTASLNFRKGFIPKNQIIVLDDFERVGSRIYQDLFSLVDYLRREKNCRLILMCNEDEIIQQKDLDINVYRGMREKVVDRVYDFKPSRESTEKILEKNGVPKDVIEKFIKLFDIKSNFRALIRASYDFRELTEKLEDYCGEQQFDKSICLDLLKKWEKNCSHELALMYIKSSGQVEVFREYQKAYSNLMRKSDVSKEEELALRSKAEFKFFSDLDSTVAVRLGINLSPLWLENYFDQGVDGVSNEKLIRYIDDLQYHYLWDLYNEGLFYASDEHALYNKFKSSIIQYLKKLPSEIARIEKRYWDNGSISESYKSHPVDIYFLCQILIELKEIQVNEETEIILARALQKLVEKYEDDLLGIANLLDINAMAAGSFLSGLLLGHLFNSYCSSNEDKIEYARIVETIKSKLKEAVQRYKLEQEKNLLIYSEKELISFLESLRPKLISKDKIAPGILFSDDFLENKIAKGSIALVEHYVGTIKHEEANNAKRVLAKLYDLIQDTNPLRKRLKKVIKFVQSELEKC